MFDILVVVVAVLGAVGIFVGIALISHIASIHQRGFFAWLFVIIIGMMAIYTLLSGRSLAVIENLFVVVPDGQSAGLGAWLGRLVSIVGLAICLERLIHVGFARRSRLDVAWPLFWSFLLYVFSTVVLSGVVGTRGGLSHRFIYPTLAVFVAVLVAAEDGLRSMRFARNALLIFLVVSVFLVPVMPDLVLQRNYQGISIPGVHVRYWGLATHANSLGPLAGIFLMLLWNDPLQSRGWNMAAWFLGSGSLLLTLSKTAFGLTAIGLIVMSWYRIAPRIGESWRRGQTSYLMVVMLFSSMLLLIAAAGLIITGEFEDFWGGFVATRAGSDVYSLTGRDVIWTATLAEWRSNLWFGYGPSLWDEEHRIRVGLPHALHAHNQFVHALGAGGVLGLAGTLVYFLMLGGYCFRFSSQTRGLTMALFIAIAMRCITEVPLMLNGFTGADFFAHLLLVTLCAHHAVQREVNSIGTSYRPKMTESVHAT